MIYPIGHLFGSERPLVEKWPEHVFDQKGFIIFILSRTFGRLRLHVITFAGCDSEDQPIEK